jgi:hypothetical protein
MQYLQKTFSIRPPDQVTCCEACVYKRGPHADWCPKKEQTTSAINHESAHDVDMRLHLALNVTSAERAAVMSAMERNGWALWDGTDITGPYRQLAFERHQDSILDFPCGRLGEVERFPG